MAWIVSIVSLLVVLLMTRKWRYAPICGVIGQGLWVFYAIMEAQYGLLPAVIGYTVIYALAIPKWLNKA